VTASSALAELAPTGKLRVGIMYTNPVVASRDANGNLGGLSVALARELGRRLGTPVELVGYENTKHMMADLKRGAWDIAFTAIAPDAVDIDYSPPYLEAEGTFLVPGASAFRGIEDVDREGIRVAVSGGSSLDSNLTRILKRAELVRIPGAVAAFELFRADKADVLAGVRQRLAAVAPQIPGSRILDGRFMVIENAVAIPKNHTAGASYVRSFVEDVKASGLVLQLMTGDG
jgi:polar amino acid transport system substrate-binding protein